MCGSPRSTGSSVRERLRRGRGHPHARRLDTEVRDGLDRRSCCRRWPAARLTKVRELYGEYWSAARAPSSTRASIRAGPTGSSRSSRRSARRRAQLVVDIGARDGKHLRFGSCAEHGVEGSRSTPFRSTWNAPRSRARLDDPSPPGAIEEHASRRLSADWIWCRDVLVHVDVERGLGECARVLQPGGRMLAYVTLATDLLEPREAAWLLDASRLATLDGARIEAAAAAAGLELAEKTVLGGEWRERMIEEGEWDANEALLRLSRLRRRGTTGSEGGVRRRQGLGHLPAARQALPDGLPLAAPMSSGSPPRCST